MQTKMILNKERSGLMPIKCAICGYEFGVHEWGTNRCPDSDPDIPIYPPGERKFRDTVFVDESKGEI